MKAFSKELHRSCTKNAMHVRYEGSSKRHSTDILAQLLMNGLQFWNESDCLIQIERNTKRNCTRDYMENTCREVFTKMEN